MARKTRRSNPVPKVLWEIYKEKARSLAATITAIIPPPPSTTTSSSRPFCFCHGRTCLQCFENRMAFLLRKNDPLEYKRLLFDCNVVVDDDAPFLEYSPDRHFSQKEIVERVIEMMPTLRPNSCNVLCTSYNKLTKSNTVVKHLTSSAWDTLLERVGDRLMVYLLQHTSIFVPLSRWKHLQVAGSRINNICKKLQQSGATKKRKRTDYSNAVSKRQQHISYSSCSVSLNSIRFVGSGTGEAVPKSDEASSGDFQIFSNQAVAKLKKSGRIRPWKRDKKRRQQSIEECRDNTTCGTCSDESCLLKSAKYPSITDQMPLKCACYLMLKDPLLHSNSKEISRQSMFYNLESSSSVLPQEHILNSLVPNFSNAKRLMGIIFGLPDVNVSSQPTLCSHDRNSCLAASPCLYHSFLKLLKKLIRNNRRGNYFKLLVKYCLDNVQLETNRHYCLHSEVEAFVWAVCRRMVPSDLLGTPSNQRILRRNISKFICLRRFEKFSLKQCLHQLRRLDFPFLSNHCTSCCLNGIVPKNGEGQKNFSGESFSVHAVKHKLFVTWIFWLFSSLVVPLVQSNFYVTENEDGKNDAFYYPKSVWEKFKDHAITHLKEKSYVEIDEAVLKTKIYRRPFGFSKLRICPKTNGVRLLVNHKATSRVLEEGSCSNHKYSCMDKKSKPPYRKAKAKHFKSVNYVLRSAHTVIKGLSMKEPEKLGSSVFNYNEVHEKLCLFLSILKNFSTIMPKVFIVIADVSKAFDSIKQDNMVRMIEDFLVEDKYNLQQIHQVVSSKNCLWDQESLVLAHETVSENLVSSIQLRSLPGILVDQGCSKLLSKEELLFNLKEHVQNNVLQLDKKYYLQGMGISQGSVLSSLLCSLYYGHMEKHEIYPYLEKIGESTQHSGTHYLLLRYIDDYLFISTSKEQARGFLSMLQRGFPDYNCNMNEEKFCTNFDIENQEGVLTSNKVYVADDGTSFLCWSGLLINCTSLEIQVDYTRYVNNHLKSTLTVRWQGRPGRNLKRKLRGFIQPRCYGIFFDLNINSPSVVRLNIYQVFLLCAMRFHCYVLEFSRVFKPRPRFCSKIIQSSFRYMYKLMGKRMESVSLGSTSYTVKKEEVVWLGLHAYIAVLKRKESRYKMLLSTLKYKFYTHKVTGNESAELSFAVEKSHSSCLWRIKY